MSPGSSAYKGVIDKSLERNKSLERAMLQDNPSNGQLYEISKYIKNLDQRLSIPKFTDEEGYSPRMAKRRNSINHNSQLSISKQQTGSTSRSPRRNGIHSSGIGKLNINMLNQQSNAKTIRKRNLGLNELHQASGSLEQSPVKSANVSQNQR